MRVCIILSTYNGKKYVCQQLDSIFQSAEDMDIFLYVRDDGSKDDTIQILEEYGKKNNVEIKIDRFKPFIIKEYIMLIISTVKKV